MAASSSTAAETEAARLNIVLAKVPRVGFIFYSISHTNFNMRITFPMPPRRTTSRSVSSGRTASRPLPRDAGNAYGRRQPVEAPLPVPVAEGQDCCSNVAEEQDGREKPGSKGISDHGYGLRFLDHGLGLGHISDPGGALLISSHYFGIRVALGQFTGSQFRVI